MGLKNGAYVNLGDRTPTHDKVLDIHSTIGKTLQLSCAESGVTRYLDIPLTNQNVKENEITTFMLVDDGAHPRAVEVCFCFYRTQFWSKIET